MIICSCNVLSEREVRAIIESSDGSTAAREVYRRLGRAAECDRCARTIRAMIGQSVGRGRHERSARAP
jgi:bacterioferritin-associated ferredoxin